MASQTDQWTKKELEIYILLLCANADSVQTEEEIKTIKQKYDEATFENIYREFLNDSEEEALQKIEDNICYHEYSFKELSGIRNEMKRIFYSDNKYSLPEQNLERVLNRILY